MNVLALFGPTGVGKTDVAIELANLLRERGEDPVAVSADALQVYEGLEALTDKPSEAQLELLEHRLISFVPIDKQFNAYLYAKEAHREIDRLLDGGRRPIVVGGTGLYLRAALAELDMRPAQDEKKSQLWSAATRRPTLLIGLTMKRQLLYERIDRRVCEMVEGSARDEVEEALGRGASRTARKAIGFDLLAGDADDEPIISEMQRDTRNYAKRQLTWMRKTPNVSIIDRSDLASRDVAHEIAARIDSIT